MKNFKLFEKCNRMIARRVTLIAVLLATCMPQVWGWGSSAGTVVYFDRQNCTSLFTTGPYFRIGDDGWNNKYDMYIVPGTKYLYYHNLGQYTYGAFAVANGYGWEGSGDGKSIYQPSDKQYGKEGYSGGAVISQQTEYYKQNISGNFYIKLTGGTGNYDYGCQYYQYEHGELPTYSISYSKTGSGTLTVQQYTGSTYTALASGTTGLKPTQIIKITTSPSTDYALASLTVTGATQIDGGNTYYITGNCTISATFDYQWAIKGSGTEMGSWGTFFSLAPTATENEYEGTVTLAANKIYEFVITDRRTSTDYKYGESGYNLTYSGQSSAPAHDLETGGSKQNLVIMSAGAGTYTFTWNKSTKRLKVKFPTVTHPSTDYIYFKHTQGWNITDYVICSHIWGGPTTSTAWNRLPTNDSFNFDGTTYYYTALGDNNTALFAGSQNTSDNQTENLTNLGTSGTKRGKYYDYTSGANEDARWQPFTATLTLDHQGPLSNTPNPNSITVTYGAGTNINTDVITTRANKNNYTWGGYYTEPGGEGVQIINTSEKIPSNLDGYTSSGKWIKTGSSVSATIYAKWTQSIKLDDHGGTADGSATVAFNGTSMKDITAPTFDGYTVDGYYKESSCTHLIMSAVGALQASTDYTDASSKWTRTGSAPTLHAHWKINPPTITNECNKITISTTAAGTTIYYTTDGSTPTNKSSVYDPSNKPTLASNTTVKAFATKSGCTDSEVATEVLSPVTTYSVNYNANLDGTSGSTASQTGHCQDDVVATSACGFSKDNYKFKWWNKSSAGTGEDFYPGEEVTFTSSANIPLYAQWEPVASGWAYWNGNDGGSGSPIDVTGNGVTMRLTKNNVDYNTGIQDYTVVSKYSGTTVKHANVLAMDAANEYLQVHFTDGSPINALQLGTVHNETSGTKKVVVIYSTTADFSTGEHEEIEVTIPHSYQETKGVTSFSPSTPDKYLYARIYKSVSTAVYSYTGPASGGAGKMRIYSIKAQKGTACGPNGLAYETATVNKTYGDAAFTNTLTNAHSLAVSYSSGNDDVATVSSTGEVTIKGAGSTTITATWDGSVTYCAGTASYTLNVAKASISPSLSYDETTLTAGDDSSSPTITGNSGNGTVTYASDDTDVATVDENTGVVTAVAAGTATITATIAATANYNGNTTTATFTVNAAFVGSSSINIEKWVLDNRKNLSGLQTALTSANISYDLSGDCSLDSLNDGISDGKYKKFRNYPYLGLKIKNSGSYVSVNLPKDKALNVKFGYIEDSVKVFIGDTEIKPSPIKSNKSNASKTYTLSSSGSNRTVKFQTPNGKAVVIKQIMVGESLESITLPAKITLGATTNGTISVENTKVNVGSTVAITVTPSSGYELDELTVTRDTIDSPSVSVTDNEFTMPNNNVTINASFALSCSAPGVLSILPNTGISGVGQYEYGETIELEASCASGTDESTTYAWYKGPSWNEAKEAGAIQAAATAAEDGNVYTKSAELDDSGSYWCEASNGAGCNTHNLIETEINVGKATFTPVLNYASLPIPVGSTREPVLTGVPVGAGTATYTSSNTSVAEVNSETGVVTAKAAGNAIITVSIAESANYIARTATKSISVRAAVLYTVTFDPNGGTIDESSDPVVMTQETEGEELTMPTPVHATYTFDGWYIADTEIGDEGAYTPTKNVTAYAKWIEECSGGGVSVEFTSSNKNDNGEYFADFNSTSQMVGTGSAKLIAIGDAKINAANKKDGYRSDSRMEMVFKFASSSTLDVYVTTGSTSRTYALYSFSSAKELSAIEAADYSSNTIVSSNVTATGATFANTTVQGTPSVSSGVITISGTAGGVKISYTNLSGYYVFKAHGSSESYIYGFDINGGSSSGCYRVNYHSNGADGGLTFDPMAYDEGDLATVVANGFTFEHETEFLGWNTEEDGSGTMYRAGDKLSISDDDIDLYAQWMPINRFQATEDWFWNNEDNWSHGVLPSASHKVIIEKPCELRSKYGLNPIAKVKTVVIDKYDDNTGRLTIVGPAGLAVEEMIKTKNAEGELVGTSTTDLNIDSSSDHENGALAVKGYTEAGGVDLKATVTPKTKARVFGWEIEGEYNGFYVNQFIGTPMLDAKGSDYYGSWLYRWDATAPEEGPDAGKGDWVYASGALAPFQGYTLLFDNHDETYLWLTGTLVYSDSKVFNLAYDERHENLAGTETMLANSYLAPIDVTTMTTTDFAGGDEDKMEATIYVFNSGTPNNWSDNEKEGKGDIGELPGQFLCMSIHSAEYTGGVTEISSMQAFSVYAKSTGATFNLDYERMVYNPLKNRDTGIAPMRAPSNKAATNDNAPDVMKIMVECEHGADKLFMLTREDFNAGFDNGWDARKMFGESFAPQLYAFTPDGSMSVNCVPDEEGAVLGFRKGSADNVYTFSFTYNGEKMLYLNDTKEQLSTLISDDAEYTFVSETGDTEARFIISETPYNAPTVTTGFEGVNGEQKAKVHKVLIDDHIYIIRGGRMYDATGKMLK